MMQGLLGDARDFKDEFEGFITAGTDKHATMRAREMGSARAAQLRARLAPFFLRRDKKEVLGPARYPPPTQGPAWSRCRPALLSLPSIVTASCGHRQRYQ